MKQELLWAPWRLGYLVSTRRGASRGCLFCRANRSREDAKNLLLLRGRRAFVLMNRYPYNNGHVMVAPSRHVGRLERLTPAEWSDLLELSKEAMRRIRRSISPHGFNLGINLGRSAGAGIPGHLHLHIVPRWTGDTNFMPVVGRAKVISQSLDSAYRLLKRSGASRGAASDR